MSIQISLAVILQIITALPSSGGKHTRADSSPRRSDNISSIKLSSDGKWPVGTRVVCVDARQWVGVDHEVDFRPHLKKGQVYEVEGYSRGGVKLFGIWRAPFGDSIERFVTNGRG